jgi:hypothetical protein
MSKDIIIIQTGFKRSGTTFLVNLLYGFIIPNEAIHGYFDIEDEQLEPFSECSIFKSHILNIEDIINKYSNKYQLYFIITERDKKIDEKYKELYNVLIFDYYKELLETEDNSIQNIIDNAYIKLSLFLPDNIYLSKEWAINRINNMNNIYEEIKECDFSYIDDFFALHGSHRNYKFDS